MYLLISTEQNTHFSVAVGNEDITKIMIVNKPYKQSELLLKTIQQLVVNKFSIIKSLIVVQGPGQFSALRVGISTANALASSLSVPIVGLKLKKAWLELEEKEKLVKVYKEGLLKLKKKQSDKIVKPFYGQQPNINIKK